MKRTALTFDDGPNGRYTLKILEILKEYDIKACFFLIGENVEYYPHIAVRIKKQGHLIGNHTYSHKHLKEFSSEDILWQIEKAEAVFKRMLGIKPEYMRLPYGECDKAAKKIVKDKGYKLIEWKPRIEDWKALPGRIADDVISKARNGSIITLHDGANIRHGESRINTVKALPEIIKRLQAKGFKIVRLDRLCQG